MDCGDLHNADRLFNKAEIKYCVKTVKYCQTGDSSYNIERHMHHRYTLGVLVYANRGQKCRYAGADILSHNDRYCH